MEALAIINSAFDPANKLITDFYNYYEILKCDTEDGGMPELQETIKTLKRIVPKISRDKLIKFLKEDSGKNLLDTMEKIVNLQKMNKIATILEKIKTVDELDKIEKELEYIKIYGCNKDLKKNLKNTIKLKRDELEYRSRLFVGSVLKRYSNRIQKLFAAKNQIENLPVYLRLNERTVNVMFNKSLICCKADRISIGYLDSHYSLILMDKNGEHIFNRELGYPGYKEIRSIKGVFDSLRYFCNKNFPEEKEEEKEIENPEELEESKESNYYRDNLYLVPKNPLLSALHLLYSEEKENILEDSLDIFNLAKIRISKTSSFSDLKNKLDSHIVNYYKNNILFSKNKSIEGFLEKNKFLELRTKLKENVSDLSQLELAQLSALLLIYFENISNDIKIRNDIISIAINHIKNNSVYKRIRYDFDNNNSLKIDEYLDTYDFFKLKNQFAK